MILISPKNDGILDDINNKNSWNWYKTIDYINLELPYYFNMCCCIRVSKKLLNIIKEYVNINKTLFFIEVLFITLTIKNKLTYIYPKELNNIYYDKKFDNFDDKNIFYHPVKDIDKHHILRNNL